MPAVIRETQPVPMSKKRRRDGDDNRDNISTIQLQSQPLFPSQTLHHPNPDLYITTRTIPADKTFDFHAAASPRKILSPHCSKRQRLTSDSPGRQQAAVAAKLAAWKTSPARVNATLLLNRCHICSRKPSKKSDFDSFTDCESCGQRTCFVCIRQCLGWHQPHWEEDHRMEEPPEPSHDGGSTGQGDRDFSVQVLKLQEELLCKENVDVDRRAKGGHRQTVCSGCCVERGADGDVVCLGCLPYAAG